MKTTAIVALLALTVVNGPCDDPGDTPPAGYAVVAGTLPPVLGYETTSDVRVSCGIGHTDEWSTFEDAEESGSYRVALTWPSDLGAADLEAAGWLALCRVEAPASGPPYAEAVDTVLFAPTRGQRVTTTLDLVPVDD